MATSCHPVHVRAGDDHGAPVGELGEVQRFLWSVVGLLVLPEKLRPVPNPHQQARRRHLLRAYCVLGIVLEAGDVVLRQTDNPCLLPRETYV